MCVSKFGGKHFNNDLIITVVVDVIAIENKCSIKSIKSFTVNIIACFILYTFCLAPGRNTTAFDYSECIDFSLQ